MTWCPLRLWRLATSHLRGRFKREYIVDVHLVSRDDHFMDQALNDGLPLFKGELFQIVAQQLAKARRVVHHLLPVDGLLLGLRQALAVLLQALEFGGQLLAPGLQFAQADDLCLVSV